MAPKTENGRFTAPLARYAAPLRLLLWAAGAAAWVWAFSSNRFLDAEGIPIGLITFPLAAGIALWLAALSLGRRWQAAGLWLALALIGQAASLQLILAGPALRYQHYRPLDTHPLLLGVLLLQAILVGRRLRPHLPAIGRWLRLRLRPWQLALLALLFWLSSATVSESIPFYLFELAFAAAVQTLHLATLLLVAGAPGPALLTALRRRLDRWLAPPGPAADPIRLDRFAWAAAAWIVLLAALLNLFSYQRHPHVPDEAAYVYHARYIASGEQTMPAPPSPSAFAVYLMQFEGDQWYPSPPPGWPAILSLGTRFGADWLVNPLLGGLNLLLAYLLLQSLYSRRLARATLFLLAASPWYIFLAMSFMTHMATLLCALLAALGVDWARRSGRSAWAWLGGIPLGMLALIRPLEAVAVAGLLGLWAIGVGARRLKLAGIVGLVLMAMVAGSATLLYNAALTGDPTQFPIMVYTDERFGPNANALGFGPDRGMGWALDPFPGHSPRDAVINANLNLFGVNVELFGWSIGSLLFAGLLLLSGRASRSDYAMLALIVVIFTLHFFYYFSGGPDFGARYWFLMILPLAALTARGVELAARWLDAAQPHGGTRVWLAVTAVSLMALVTFVPWRAVDKYHHFRGMRPDVRALAETHAFGRSLVFVRGAGTPDYASAAVYNPVDMYADDPIYVWDRDPALWPDILDAYPGRPIWIVSGPTVTGHGYQLTAGPLSAAELLANR